MKGGKFFLLFAIIFVATPLIAFAEPIKTTVLSDNSKTWKTSGKNFYDDDKLKEALSLSTWRFVNGILKFKPPYQIKSSRYPISQSFYDEYKKYTWKHGIMHYDDVLYFAYKLIEKYPFTLS